MWFCVHAHRRWQKWIAEGVESESLSSYQLWASMMKEQWAVRSQAPDMDPVHSPTARLKSSDSAESGTESDAEVKPVRRCEGLAQFRSWLACVL
jgi:hypothetical protein